MAHETGLSIATFPVDEATDEKLVIRHDGVVVTFRPTATLEMPTEATELPAGQRARPE